jgi:hypothetical protein
MNSGGFGRLECPPHPTLAEILYQPALMQDLEHVLVYMLQIDAAHVANACKYQHSAEGNRFPPGYHVFIRGPHTEALAEVLQLHAGVSPWWSRDSSLSPISAPSKLDSGLE